ncbi:hypothetical protein TN53_43785, partial [Streptomyces sp. WM6386]
MNPDLEVPGALADQGSRRVHAQVAWFPTKKPQVATLVVFGYSFILKVIRLLQPGNEGIKPGNAVGGGAEPLGHRGRRPVVLGVCQGREGRGQREVHLRRGL